MHRPGFVVSPRVVVPALLVVVLVLVASIRRRGNLVGQRVAATIVVGTAILLLLGVFAILSRSRRPGRGQNPGGAGVESVFTEGRRP